MIYIYGLYDCDGCVRYIGQAKNPKTRPEGHWNNRNDEPVNSRKNLWLRSLNGPPEIRILAIVENKRANKVEENIIKAACKEFGARITNIMHASYRASRFIDSMGTNSPCVVCGTHFNAECPECNQNEEYIRYYWHEVWRGPIRKGKLRDMAIQAIETHYSGYRFRSRLEARWAVFLDTVGIGWEYEPEGVRVDTPAGRINYLPDFWLETGQWAEVKGYLDTRGMVRLWSLATGLSGCGRGNDVVIMGNIPRPGSALWAVQLHAHGNNLYGAAWDPNEGCALRRPHVRVRACEQDAERLCAGFPFGVPDWAEPGLDRARQARFEWGESG